MNFSVEQFEFYLCILVRMAAFIYTAPFFNQKNMPQKVKILFSMIFAFVLFQILPYEPLNYSTSIGFVIIIAKEVLAGAIMGFFANLCYHILAFAGHLLDTEIGFSMVQEFDPLLNTQVTITSNLYSYSVMLMMLVTNMHHFIIKAIADSFELIPVGTVTINPALHELMTDFVVNYFVIGFRIVLPMFASILIINIILGILAKVAPQMNMFVIGLQLKVLVGLIILIFMIGMLPMVSDFIFENMMDMLRMSMQFLK